MHLREPLFQARAQIEKILKRQVRVQAADDVKFSNRFGISGSRYLEGLLQRHRIGTQRVFLAPESAQAARRYAYIRRIDMAVDVEIRLVAMHPLSHKIRHPADGEDVACPVKHKRIRGIKTRARENFFMDRLQPRIVRLKRVRGRRVRREHPFDDTRKSLIFRGRADYWLTTKRSCTWAYSSSDST